MKHIFYFIGVCFVIYELNFLAHIKQKVLEIRKIREIGNYKKMGKVITPEEVKFIINKIWPPILYYFWVMIGLFSFNWPIFLFYLLYITIIAPSISKLTIKTKIYFVWITFNTIIGLLVGLFVIINSYHLKINVYEYIKTIWF